MIYSTAKNVNDSKLVSDLNVNIAYVVVRRQNEVGFTTEHEKDNTSL
jgi:hypothetical protein